MGEQLNVAWPMARIMRKAGNGAKTCVGIQYQWTTGEKQDRFDGKTCYPSSELIYIPIAAHQIETKKTRPPLK